MVHQQFIHVGTCWYRVVGLQHIRILFWHNHIFDFILCIIAVTCSSLYHHIHNVDHQKNRQNNNSTILMTVVECGSSTKANRWYKCLAGFFVTTPNVNFATFRCFAGSSQFWNESCHPFNVAFSTSFQFPKQFFLCRSGNPIFANTTDVKYR